MKRSTRQWPIQFAATEYRVIDEKTTGELDSQNSGDRFLFVKCNGRTGRPSRTLQPLLSRHAAGNNNVATNSYYSDEIILEDRPRRRKFPANAPASKTRKHEPARVASIKNECTETPNDHHVDDDEHRLSDASPAQSTEALNPAVQTLVSSSHRHQEELAQWWFYCGDELLPPWEVAQYHWGTAAWDIARNSNLFLECLELYSWRKRAQLTGQSDRYIAQQLLLIRRTKDNLIKHGDNLESEPLALVAIGILAYVSLLDANLEASAMHLRALRAFDLPRHFEHSKQGWLYMVWVDLRFSLIQNMPPLLDYFIPKAFRDALPSLSQDDESRIQHLACQNSSSSPTSRLFDEVESHCVFLKLHRLYEAYPSLQESAFPAYGILYDLEYRLRVTHARLRQNEPKDTIFPENAAIGLNSCVELVLIAVQLHVWIVSRHLAPISTYTRKSILDRACDLIRQASAPILATKWKCVGDTRSLIWCLAIITACSLETSVNKAVTPLRALQYALASYELFTRDELDNLMREWFWLDNWHPQKIELVWKAIEEWNFEKLSASLEQLRIGRECFFVGAVEFYNDR